MADTLTIGIDLGGTDIKGSLVDATGTLVCSRTIPTEAARGPQHVLARIAWLIEDLRRDEAAAGRQVIAAGIGSPGPLSCRDGVVYQAANLPGWNNVPIRANLAAASGLPITLENDANAAAYAEFVAGAGRGTENMVLLTLGTGIGGGVIVDGHLQHGAFENAGEIGHTIVQPDGRPCPCGQRGCLERYASASAVAQRYLEAARQCDSPPTLAGRGDVTSADVAAAARAGDEIAARVWDEACRYLAVACVNLQHVLNPERIVLGGGMMNAGEQVLEPTRRHYAALRWQLADDTLQIVPALLGNRAGMIGAALLARYERMSGD